MNQQGMTLIMIPQQEWEIFKATQEQILAYLKQRPANPPAALPISYITANEFMEAVRIKRTKFDELVAKNKIRTLKKGRKIYLPITEINNYFTAE